MICVMLMHHVHVMHSCDAQVLKAELAGVKCLKNVVVKLDEMVSASVLFGCDAMRWV